MLLDYGLWKHIYIRITHGLLSCYFVPIFFMSKFKEIPPKHLLSPILNGSKFWRPFVCKDSNQHSSTYIMRIKTTLFGLSSKTLL